jgi:hypothetical protein
LVNKLKKKVDIWKRKNNKLLYLKVAIFKSFSFNKTDVERSFIYCFCCCSMLFFLHRKPITKYPHTKFTVYKQMTKYPFTKFTVYKQMTKYPRTKFTVYKQMTKYPRTKFTVYKQMTKYPHTKFTVYKQMYSK